MVGAVLDGFEDHGWTDPPAEPDAARAAVEQEATAITTGVVGLVVATRPRWRWRSPTGAPGAACPARTRRATCTGWSAGHGAIPTRRQVFETAAVVHDAVVEGRAATGAVLPAVPAPWLETEVSDNVVRGPHGHAPLSPRARRLALPRRDSPGDGQDTSNGVAKRMVCPGAVLTSTSSCHSPSKGSCTP